MKTLMKQIKTTFIITAIALGLMVSSTQQCRAAYYDEYYSWYVYYLNLYVSTAFVPYYYDSLAYYYYYLAGLNGDYAGFNYDVFGYKSTQYRGGNSNAGYYYNSYAYSGDYWAHF